MADDNDEGTDADVIWAAVGVMAGGALTVKVFSAMGAMERDLAPVETLLFLALFLAPIIGLMIISKHLHADVIAEKSTKATYWTTMIGISVTSLTLVGITSIDDLIAMAKTLAK
ncbi:hypothetical protein [Streptomyces sp. f150]|uniref:hypothetical protein n=1 Tax=Streptomyces sp. f150 TaxID=1827699 RepID=UPI000BF156AB|nr:hypothetical protein [Streptomyces sp. f150]